MIDSHSFSRRRFLVTGASALGLAPMALLRAQEGAANDEIAVGVVGCGSMGTGNMTNFLNIPGVRVVAVCDVDAEQAAKAKKRVDDFYKNSDCKVYARHTELLGHPGLDVVSLATPDHWHAQIGIDAANAGMDIYGEKPFTWGLKEGRQLVEALTRNKRVWQTGSWQRPKNEFRRFKALVGNGTLGKLTRYECGTPSGMSIQKLPPHDAPPATLDWRAWCGPGGEFPYNSQIHPWNWRWLHNFGGGQLLDWVGHHVDIALWTLGLDRTGPVEIEGTGKRGDHDLFDTYVEYDYRGTFADGRVIEVSSRFMGTKFTGENGWLHVDRGSLKASDPALLRNLPEDFELKIPSHQQNFIDCVRSRQTPASDAEGSHRAASFGQLGLAAIDTGRPLKWDPEKEAVIGDDEQARHPRLGSRVKA